MAKRGAGVIRSRPRSGPPLESGAGTPCAAGEDGRISEGEAMMTATAAANDAFARPAWTSIDDAWAGIAVPKGHVGPVLLSATGRTVWWTGRVAIGLRYEPRRPSEAPGRSAEWIQRVLLRCG
jgi:hypothetical protein